MSQVFLSNKILANQYDNFKKKNAFTKEHAMTISENRTIGFISKSVCTVVDDKAYIDPIKIKADARKMMRVMYIISIILPLFTYIYIRLFRMDAYNSHLDVIILVVVFFLLLIGGGYLGFMVPYRKFFKNIYVNESGECNYHEGDCFPNERRL